MKISSGTIYRLIVTAAAILGLFLILLSCEATRRYSSEYFVFDDTNREIYHVSSSRDTTLLDWGDVRILNIDSVRTKYLEYKAER